MYRQPAERPKNRLPLLDRLTVKTPCTVSWEAMSGDDRARFCFACSKAVYDVKAMSQDEAEAFLAVHLDDEDAAVRLYRRPDGRLLASDCPRGATRRHQKRVALAAWGTACAVALLGAALGDVRIAGAHHSRPSSRFEVPRAPVSDAPPPRDYEIDPPTTARPWGREESPSAEPVGVGQGFGHVDHTTLVFIRFRDAVEVEDESSKDAVLQVVRKSTARVRACYDGDPVTVYGGKPALAAVAITIGRDGHVMSAGDSGSSPHGNFAECILESTRRLVFPAPGPVPVTVTLEFTFQSS